MSKYIIDTDKYYLHEFDGALIVMMHEGKPVSVYESKDNLEELNSDYINEHYGELKDDAYKRGLEDAWEAARKIVRMPEGDLLNIFTECYSAVCTALQVLLKYDASEAIAKLKAYEEKKEDDSIKVGDEVIWKTDDIALIVTSTYKNSGYDWCDGVAQDGKVYRTLAENNQKTGKHYDIQSILEAMKH